jgi:alpha-D-ribose 1-methylphosphonate 5-triphosphate synthase subunit PhnG
MSITMNELAREEWVGVLNLVPDSALHEVVDSFPGEWLIKPKSLPQAGLGMLKMRDSAFGEPFYLGEFPLATCWITVTTQEGNSAEGAALIMDDQIERAEQIALCDAVLSSKLPGWQKVQDLIDHGKCLKEKQAIERKAMLALTRVDFSLLDDVGESNA